MQNVNWHKRGEGVGPVISTKTFRIPKGPMHSRSQRRSVPVGGGAGEVNLDGLLGFGDVVILAVGLPARDDDLDQHFALTYFRRTRDAFLIGLQVEFVFFLLREPEIDAGIGHGFIGIASGYLDAQTAGGMFVRSRRLIGLRGEHRRNHGQAKQHEQKSNGRPKEDSFQHKLLSDVSAKPQVARRLQFKALSRRRRRDLSYSARLRVALYALSRGEGSPFFTPGSGIWQAIIRQSELR